MKFEYGQKQFIMKFAYKDTNRGRQTEVRIYTDDYHNPVDLATVICHKTDKFTKDKGRRFALKKLCTSYPSDFRAIIWDSYLQETFNGHLRTKKYKNNEGN